jgi:hypothetical protein
MRVERQEGRYDPPHALYEVETQAKLKSTALDHSAIVSCEVLTSFENHVNYIVQHNMCHEQQVHLTE